MATPAATFRWSSAVVRRGGIIIAVCALGAVAFVFVSAAEVGHIVERFTGGLLDRFRDDDFPLVLAAAILAVAVVVGAGYLLFVVFPKISTLRSLRGAVERCDDGQAFAERLTDISGELSRNWLIGHAWREFSETLVTPHDGVTVVQNTTRPHTFINFSCAQERSVALRIMPHLPNYFVGAGLLLTFVGLVAALSFASQSIAGGAGAAVKGLQEVLAAATFKFWTSVAGLLSSIVLSFLFRYYAIVLEGAFSSLCQALERRMEFATPQRIFVDVRDTISDQLSETKKFNTEVAMAIADGVGRQLREHMPQMLASAVEPLVNVVQDSSSKVREGAVEGLEDLVAQFVRTLEGSAGEYLKQMSETLRQLIQTLESMRGEMDSSRGAFADGVSDAARRLEDMMRAHAERLETQVRDAGRVFAADLQESLKGISEQGAETARLLAQRGEEASAGISKGVQEAVEALSAAAADNARGSAEFAEKVRAGLDGSVDSLRSALDGVRGSVSELQGHLDRQGQALSSVAQRSEAAAEAMAGASRAINAGLAPFQTVGDSINQSARRFESSVSAMADQIGGAVATVDAVSRNLAAMSDAIGSAWTSYRDRFEGVDQDLERVFEKLSDAVQHQQHKVQEFVIELDKSFTKALSGLSGGIESIGMAIEELVDEIRKMNDAGARGPEG